MGEVLICRPTDGGPPVAFKSFQKRFFLSPESRQAFSREIAVWALVTGQPWVMPALGVTWFDERPFVMMPAVSVDGRDAATVRELLSRGPLTWQEVLLVALPTALGMSAARTRVPGLVHGDLKPENLLILGGMIAISDFGLARAAALPGSGVMESTWAYRAPEAWDDGASETVHADVYAFGAILFELITGATPFQATTREEWETAHRDRPVGRPGPLDPPAPMLLAIALRCLEKRPEDRPHGFDVIAAQLRQVADEHDPVEALMLLHALAEAKARLAEHSGDLRQTVVENLLRIGEHELALAQVEDLEHDQLDSSLARLTGTALSLGGRDEEALALFDRALVAATTDEERRVARSERALSLKRLGRYDEAIAIFAELAATAPAEARPGVLVNLATAYLAARRPQAVIDVLEPIAVRHHRMPEIWANLGLAYEDLGDYETAATMFQRGLASAPHRADLLLPLARIYMEHLGLVAEAVNVLELMLEQGEAAGSPEWLVRILAGSIVLGRTDVVETLRRMADSIHANEEDAAELDAAVDAVVERTRASLRAGGGGHGGG
jgi:tetratricopeptide (TPR) repeat protein